MSNEAGLSELKRGDVVEVILDPVVGHETGKTRPALIVQNDTGNKFSPTVIVAVISSVKEISKPLPIMYFLRAGDGGLKVDSYVDCGQIRTLNKEKRIVRRSGALSHSQMDGVNKALCISLALN